MKGDTATHSTLNRTIERGIEREMLLSFALILALGIVAIVLLLFLAVFVPARLSGGIKGLSVAIHEVSMGKRQSPIESSGLSDFSVIEQAVERLRLSVNGMLQRLVPMR